MDNKGHSADVPNIILDLQYSNAPPELTTTLLYNFNLILRRQSDSRNEPCVIKWKAHDDGFSRGHFVLLRETEVGFEKVDLHLKPSSSSSHDHERSIKVSKYRVEFRELQPNSEVSIPAAMPEHYQRLLVPGETYRLDWSGGEVEYWTWSSLAEITGKELKFRGSDASSEKLFLPATVGFTFTVKEEEPWPDRAAKEAKFGFLRACELEGRWRERQAQHRRAQAEENEPLRSESQQIPGAPVLRMKLEAPVELDLGQKFQVKAYITLEDNNHNPSSIVFHTALIGEALRLARRRRAQGDEQKDDRSSERDVWEPCPLAVTDGYIFVDGPDVQVNVSRHEDFAFLRPKESWTHEFTVYEPNGAEVPTDTASQDRFRVRYVGMNLDWWDWGSAEDHVETKVSLPCFIYGRVINPRDNGGRPQARLPVSDGVEFVVKG